MAMHIQIDDLQGAAIQQLLQVHRIQMHLQQLLNRRASQVVNLNIHSHQNKKYRCAIGKLVAGSQVSSCPSARTA